MTVLDRYIAREFILTFFFVLLAFLCLYLIIDFFERIRMFLSNDAGLAQIVSWGRALTEAARRIPGSSPEMNLVLLL